MTEGRTKFYPKIHISKLIEKFFLVFIEFKILAMVINFNPYHLFTEWKNRRGKVFECSVIFQ